MQKRRKRKTNATGRNEGGEQYLPISYRMAQTKAFRSLTGTTLKVWIELRTRYNGHNNGLVSLSLREAAELLGMSQTTAQRALIELEEKGFIKRRTRGSWYGRKAAEFILTDRSYDGHEPTRDWQRWRPKNKPSVPKRTAKRGSGSSGYRDSKILVQQSSRGGKFKVIDGAA